MYYIICISGFTFYPGLILDGIDKYEDSGEFELDVITNVPDIGIWKDIKSHRSGDILKLQVIISLFITIINFVFKAFKIMINLYYDIYRCSFVNVTVLMKICHFKYIASDKYYNLLIEVK